MFDLDPGDDLALLVDTTRQLARAHLAPRLREAEAARGVAEEVRRAFAEVGLAGLELPEAHGGAGLGALARVSVNEELAAADPGATLALDPFGPALYPLLELDDEALLGGLAGDLSTPGARVVLVTDADGSLGLRDRRLTGEIAWVPADRADALVALVGPEIVLVREGIRCTPTRGAGLRAAGAAAVRLEDAPVLAGGRHPEGASRARARARLYWASLLLGVLRHACEFSRAYALERHAFGRPIAHHQALAFLITEMQMALDGARLLVHEAAWRVDRGLPCAAAAAQAFAQCIEASRLIGPNGVQILGGHGFMADYPMEKAMRESRALGLALGGIDAAVEDAGRSLCDAAPGAALALEVA